MPSANSHDASVRQAAFDFLRRETELRGEVLPWSVLSHGFAYEGTRVPLIGPQGIFKPAVLELPISITTTPVVEGKPRPYEDEIDAGGSIIYRYRGTKPGHPDNVGLRSAMLTRTPLIYNFGVTIGHYLPVWPVFVVGDDPQMLAFRVEADDPVCAARVGEDAETDLEGEVRPSPTGSKRAPLGSEFAWRESPPASCVVRPQESGGSRARDREGGWGAPARRFPLANVHGSFAPWRRERAQRPGDGGVAREVAQPGRPSSSQRRSLARCRAPEAVPRRRRRNR